MITSAELAKLTPQQRARVIYSTAQSEMTNRLWRAALGDSDRDDPSRSSVDAPAQQQDTLAQLLAIARGDPASPSSAAAGIPAGAAGASAGGPVDLDPNGHNPLAGDTPTRCTLGANARYEDLIADCAQRTGVPAAAIASIVDAEAAKHGDGSWNPLSRNPRSSAAGLGQFLSGTWIGMAEASGSWLHQFAQQRGWLDTNGKVRSDAKSTLLSMRYDPEASIRTVADFAKTNLDRLEQAGVPARESVTTIARAAYLSHNLGAGDTMRFLKGQIQPDRARVLLDAQVGSANAEQRIAAAGSAVSAHRDWLLGYIDRHIRPEKFAA
jgi:hypothetical protein